MRFTIFRRKPEPPAEKAELEQLDDVTREVGWDEFDKEVIREHSGAIGPLTAMPGVHEEPLRHVPGDPVPEPVDDPDPADERGMRDVLHEPDESA